MAQYVKNPAAVAQVALEVWAWEVLYAVSVAVNKKKKKNSYENTTQRNYSYWCPHFTDKKTETWKILNYFSKVIPQANKIKIS